MKLGWGGGLSLLSQVEKVFHCAAGRRDTVPPSGLPPGLGVHNMFEQFYIHHYS